MPSRSTLTLLMTSRVGAMLVGAMACAGGAAAAEPRRDSYVQQAQDIAVRQPGPHEGTGVTTAYPFFEDAAGFDIVFRQRALHPGASIGKHLNDKDEIYYVLAGCGELTLDGTRRDVRPGDAVLTRAGSTHALRQIGGEDLVIIVVYPRRD